MRSTIQKREVVELTVEATQEEIDTIVAYLKRVVDLDAPEPLNELLARLKEVEKISTHYYGDGCPGGHGEGGYERYGAPTPTDSVQLRQS